MLNLHLIEFCKSRGSVWFVKQLWDHTADSCLGLLGPVHAAPCSFSNATHPSFTRPPGPWLCPHVCGVGKALGSGLPAAAIFPALQVPVQGCCSHPSSALQLWLTPQAYSPHTSICALSQSCLSPEFLIFSCLCSDSPTGKRLSWLRAVTDLALHPELCCLDRYGCVSWTVNLWLVSVLPRPVFLKALSPSRWSPVPRTGPAAGR